MHQHSEYGVASHWRYKEGGGRGGRHDPDVRREDRVAAPGARLEGHGRRLERVARGVQGEPLHRRDLRADAAGQGDRPAARRDAGRLRVRRAHGPRPSLPRRAGSTARWCRSTTGCERAAVEIVAAKQGGPSRDWLNAELGYVHSNRARSKVRQWFKAQQHEETVAQGRALVERELARLGATRAEARRRRGEGGLRQDRGVLRRVRARRHQQQAGADGDPRAARSRRTRPRTDSGAGGRDAPEPRERRRAAASSSSASTGC